MATTDNPTPPVMLREADPWELATAVQAVRRHLRISAVIVAGCLTLALLAMLLPPLYTADATLAYDPQAPLTRGGGDLPMTDPLRDAQIDAQLAQATSLAVAQDVARTLDLAANPRLRQQADTLVANSDRPLRRDEALGTALLDHVKARRVGQTPDFTISFTAGTAQQAAIIANRFAAAYLQAVLSQKAALAAASARQLDTRLAELRSQATQAEAALAHYRLANNLLDIPESTVLDQEVATLRSQLADAQGQAALAGTRSAATDTRTVVGGGNGGTVDTTPVSQLTQQRAASAADLAALLGRHGEKNPDIIDARRKLAELDAQLAQTIAGNGLSAHAEARSAAARATALAASLSDARARLAASLSHAAYLLDLQNSALAARLAYQDGLKLGADQTAQRALLQPDAQQIELATPPLRPKFPRLWINLLAGLMIGLTAAVAVAFARDSWRHTLGSVVDIDRWLEADHFDPLAMHRIGRSGRGIGRRTIASDPIEAVLMHPQCVFAEGIRSLGTAALYAAGARTGSDGPAFVAGKVIGITSAVSGEGKTTVSTAMGRVLAATGMKVALLAWPGGAPAMSAARPIDSSGLAIVPGGAGVWEPDFGGDQFVRMITVLRREYQVIIINMPSILAGGADRQLLECMDALVLLVRWRSTSVRAIREALHRVAVAGGHVSGIALSMVEGAGR